MQYSKQPVRVDGLYCIRENETSYEVSRTPYSSLTDAKVAKSQVVDSDLAEDRIGYVVLPLWLAEALGFVYERMNPNEVDGT